MPPSRRTHSRSSSSRTAAKERAPLTVRHTNVTPTQKSGSSKATLQSNPPGSTARVASASDNRVNKPEVHRVTVKVKLRDVYKSDPLEMEIREKGRDEAFRHFLSHKKGNKALLTSYMPNSAPGTEEKVVGEFSLDYMNTFNIPAFGISYRMHVPVEIGEGEQIATAELLVDTGSSAIWVNKRVFDRAGEISATIIPNALFGAAYDDGDYIKGDLYEGTFTFDGCRESVKKQIFAIIDERKNPVVRRWRAEGIEGIFGIGPRGLNEGLASYPDGKKIELPTIIDNMKDQHLISEAQVGIFLDLPSEGNGHREDTVSVSTYSSTIMDGELHLGAPDWNVCNASTLKWIPANVEGDSRHFFGVDLELVYEGETVMEATHGIIDTGSIYISLPETMLNKYAEAIRRSSGREEPVVKYDKKIKRYHIAKSDFRWLKDVKFHFARNRDAVFKFSPGAQIIPPHLTRKWVIPGEKDRIFLAFRRIEDENFQHRMFRLGMQWSMWYYLVLRSSREKKYIGIAEISGRMRR